MEPVCDFKMLLGKLEAALRYKAAEEEGVLPEGEDRARSMLAGSVAEKELAAEMERGSGGGGQTWLRCCWKLWPRKSPLRIVRCPPLEVLPRAKAAKGRAKTTSPVAGHAAPEGVASGESNHLQLPPRGPCSGTHTQLASHSSRLV